MIVSSEQARNVLGITTRDFAGMFVVLRRAGVSVEMKCARNSKNHFFTMNYFDVDHAIEAITDRINNHPLRGRYKCYWKDRLEQLKQIKKGIV